jgi:hypothetical protein
MFKIPRVNVIESDEGYSVEVLGRTGIRYVEGDKTLWIDSEVLAVPNSIMVFISGIHKWNSGEPIEDETKKRITQNIIHAFTWDGTILEIK